MTPTRITGVADPLECRSALPLGFALFRNSPERCKHGCAIRFVPEWFLSTVRETGVSQVRAPSRLPQMTEEMDRNLRPKENVEKGSRCGRYSRWDYTGQPKGLSA